MPRKVRVENPGFYHIINRGVERRKVFLSKEDKDEFIKILEEVFSIYEITLHSYVLMDNHYHLLIQNHKQNLSNAMRQLNSKYAIYFNKKYNRVGHLWQGRYKSWIIQNDNYFFTLFRYFEINPIKAKLISKYGEYYRSFLYDLRHNSLLKSSQKSYFLNFNLEYLLSSLDIDFIDLDIQILEKIKKENRNLKKELKFEENIILDNSYSTKEERNKKIIEYYKKGVSQIKIAKLYNLTPSSISKIIKKD